MFIGKIISAVVSTAKVPSYKGRKIFLVRKLNLDGSYADDDTVAIDFVDAGVGDIVLVSQEGGAARKLVDDAHAPVRSFIVGIVEEWTRQGTGSKE